MTNPKAPELNENNASRYKANPDFTKYAVLEWSPKDYKLSWGEQNMDGPHMVVGSSGEDLYGCALEEFFTSHSPASAANRWFKRVDILALQVTEDTDIVTVMSDGRVEVHATVPAGHWIIRNPKGEQYYNSPEAFAERYTAAPCEVCGQDKSVPGCPGPEA